jgi:hypothetical protein
VAKKTPRKKSKKVLDKEIQLIKVAEVEEATTVPPPRGTRTRKINLL